MPTSGPPRTTINALLRGLPKGLSDERAEEVREAAEHVIRVYRYALQCGVIPSEQAKLKVRLRATALIVIRRMSRLEADGDIYFAKLAADFVAPLEQLCQLLGITQQELQAEAEIARHF